MVVALQANFATVLLDGTAFAQERLLCTRRGRLDHAGHQLCVGDRVRLEGVDWSTGRAVVAAIAPRRGLLQRPPVANVSRVVVVQALVEPAPDPLLLTRFLVAAEAAGEQVDLVFSKLDLVGAAAAGHWRQRVSRWGYEPLLVSASTGEGLEALAQQLGGGGIAVLCGPSGVGKSSLLNALSPGLQLRVGAVSGRLRRGRHTTRHVELFPLGPAGLVADTPGFNRPDLGADPARLEHLFPELRRQLAQRTCRFRNCRHLGDPGCGVASGWDRQPLYQRCREDLEAAAAAGGRRSAAQTR